MFITSLYLIWSKDHWGSRNEVGPKTRVIRSLGLESGIFQFGVVSLCHCDTLLCCNLAMCIVNCQKNIVVKTCFWFSVVSTMGMTVNANKKGCFSTTCFSTLLSPVFCLCCKKFLFLVPAGKTIGLQSSNQPNSREFFPSLKMQKLCVDLVGR